MRRNENRVEALQYLVLPLRDVAICGLRKKQKQGEGRRGIASERQMIAMRAGLMGMMALSGTTPHRLRGALG